MGRCRTTDRRRPLRRAFPVQGYRYTAGTPFHQKAPVVLGHFTALSLDALSTYLSLGDHLGGRGDGAVCDDELACAVGLELQHLDLSTMTETQFARERKALVAALIDSVRPDLAPRVAQFTLADVVTGYSGQFTAYANREWKNPEQARRLQGWAAGLQTRRLTLVEQLTTASAIVDRPERPRSIFRRGPSRQARTTRRTRSAGAARGSPARPRSDDDPDPPDVDRGGRQ